MAKICVLGAGPAGCVFAARMAALGHETHVFERERFPRRRLGESLTPGVAPLLRQAGLHRALEGRHAREIEAVEAEWEGATRMRPLDGAAGFVVERGGFDAALLEGARGFGVVAHQPARLVERRREASGWRLTFDIEGRRETFDADFLADARGRGADVFGSRRRTGPRTLALHAYWASGGPARARIAAIADGWAWAVPLPGGLTNALVFVDPQSLRGGQDSLEQAFRRRVHAGGLLDANATPEPVGPVRAIDATPYLDEDSVGADHLRLGDRALAMDPLSSSGVQKAIQSALSGAIVANTLLRRPQNAAAAATFYRSQLAETSRRHRQWAGENYAAAAASRDHAFWRARAAAAAPTPPRRPLDASFLAGVPVSLSPRAEWIETPCLTGEFVALAPALRHPNLSQPIAFLSGVPLAPLLAGLARERTALQIARGWADRVDLETGLSVAAWLAERGVLEARPPQGTRL